jgi:hypothetical protein|tara:strand:+ start:633 stop:938 length:306 start_codon:yes stop_codon:yes gene_type:complete
MTEEIREETKEEMINRLKVELGDYLHETYEVQCVFHGKITGTFNKFLNRPSGCKQCIKHGLKAWDKDFHQGTIWQAIHKLIADNKLAIKQAEAEELENARI